MVTAGPCLCQQTEGALAGARHEDSVRRPLNRRAPDVLAGGSSFAVS